VVELESALEGAVGRGEIIALFQPQFDLISGKLVAVEALCRWNLPGAGIVPPDQFIPVAEEAGFIHDIGRFMADQCCKALTEWPLDVSVNVSPLQLETPDFTDWLTDCLTDHHSKGGSLTLEITESRPIADLAPMLKRLEPLRMLGVGVALDDFGIGHSSLKQLKRLHGTEVKLDRSLVSDDSAVAFARMAEVVDLAHRSGIRVVAEGIETDADLDRARVLGCDRGQGFLLGRPQTRAQISRLVAGG
jgi:EAL domain-containing protein (putative c-di-GMP-specific phosphodiesterase class I)